MADSLEANFALDSDLEEGSSSTGQFTKPSNTSPPAKSGKRRRLEDEDGEGEGEEVEAMKVAAGASTAEKKARRKARTKARKARLALEQSVSSTSSSSSSHNPALLPGFAQVDYLRKEMRKSNAWKDLSELELGERGVGEGEVLESIDWKGGRELEDLSLFIKKFALLPNFEAGEPKGNENGQKRMGAPHILVLTNNALRAAHIARELRKLLPERVRAESSSKDGPGKKSKRQKVQAVENPDAEEKNGPPASESSMPTRPLQIAKLFSRHFTPAQQISFLATHPVLAGAGTPQRIALLLSQKKADTSRTTEHQDGEGVKSSAPLDLTNLTTLVLDAGWKDEKMRSLFDEQGVREAWVEIWEEVRERRERGEVKVLLF